jgi:hypothetical protein
MKKTHKNSRRKEKGARLCAKDREFVKEHGTLPSDVLELNGNDMGYTPRVFDINEFHEQTFDKENDDRINSAELLEEKETAYNTLLSSLKKRKNNNIIYEDLKFKNMKRNGGFLSENIYSEELSQIIEEEGIENDPFDEQFNVGENSIEENEEREEILKGRKKLVNLGNQDFKLKKRLLNAWNEISGSKFDFPLFSPLEKKTFSLLAQYFDINLNCLEDEGNEEEVLKCCALHSLNHIFKTRDKILKNNEKIKKNVEGNVE